MGTRREKPNSRSGVLICGAYGHGNAGDEAILEAIVSELRGIDPEMPITVLSRTPEATAARNGVRALHTFNFPGFLSVMRRSALYLNGGGSLIQDVTSRRSLWYYLYTLHAARRRGCRVLMYGCGIGPVKYPLDRKLVRRVLNKNVDIITLREDHSLAELRRFGVTAPELILASDPALTLPGAPAAETEAAMIAAGLAPHGRYAGFCVRRWPGFEEKAPAFAAAARHVWEKHGLTPVFLSINHRSDGQAADQVRAHLGDVPCHILREPMATGLTISILERMELVVSMRLHGLIFAAGNGVPLVGVAYDPKVTAFLDYAGQRDYVEFETMDAAQLCALTDRAAARSGDRAALAAQAAALREKESANTAAARRLLER